VAKSRSGTRGRRGPRKPVRRDVGIQGGTVLAADPRDRGAIELPSSITVKDLADLLGKAHACLVHPGVSAFG